MDLTAVAVSRFLDWVSIIWRMFVFWLLAYVVCQDDQRLAQLEGLRVQGIGGRQGGA